jgi:drug/metabolite transporter (DMT)-like permease
MVTLASALFAANGTVSKVVLTSGISSLRLTEVRCTGALLGFVAIALVRGSSLHFRLREVPFLLLFGVVGIALVQLFYFLAIERLAIGVALIVEYIAPVLVAGWTQFVWKRPLPRPVWVALGVALAGLALVVELWQGTSLDAAGVGAALAAAVTYAAYILAGEHGVRTRETVSLTCIGFAFAAVFYAAVQPWWSFPFARSASDVSLLGRLSSLHAPVWGMYLWVIVLGGVAPFLLYIGSLRHIGAARASLVAMLEPVLASIVAYAWLGETFGPWQLAGGIVVLGALALAQTVGADRATKAPASGLPPLE